MPTPKPATISDVARAAEVSLGTVSRVLNNAAGVNSALKTRVLSAARKLNYARLRQRHDAADARARREHGDIALVVFGTDETLVQLPAVAAALQGIDYALAEQGRNVLFANVPDGHRIPPFLATGRLDGIIVKGPPNGLLPPESECELLTHIKRWPHVWLLGRVANAVGDHCTFDPDAAGMLVARHFQEKGHRRVAFFNPKPGHIQFEALKVAFVMAAGALGSEATVLELDSRLGWESMAAATQEDVDALFEHWMRIPLPLRPTALFVPSDRTTIQLYAVAKRRGVRIGTDLSLISCNHEQSLLLDLNPEPTTIDIHSELIGRSAVQQLLWRMQHHDGRVSIEVLVEPTLVARDSVAALEI
jgi:LacI family transcriptional regulator